MLRGSSLSNGRKIIIIGAGFVGSSIAYAMTLKSLSDEIILVDVNVVKAQGEMLDIRHGIPYLGTTNVRSGDYSDCADADLIIITAGRNRRNEESRLDMVADNIKIMHAVVDQIKAYYTKGAILVVSNPVDVMTYACEKWMDLPNGRVFGTGCVLDTSRLAREIANYAGLNIESVKCDIVGEHGDTQFPVWSRLAIAGVPMAEFCQKANLPWTDLQKVNLHERVRQMGAAIIASKGRTHFGIATCVCFLADAVLNQRPTIAPVSSVLQGEYGIQNVAISVPSIIGVNGVEHRLEYHFAQEEYDALHHSAECVRHALDSVSI